MNSLCSFIHVQDGIILDICQHKGKETSSFMTEVYVYGCKGEASSLVHSAF